MRGPRLTLYALFDRALKRYGSRCALAMGGREITYSKLDFASNQLALVLQQRGIGVGDSVAIYLRNCLEFLVADQAIVKLGAVKVPLNEMLSADDIGYMLGHSGAECIIAHSCFAAKLDYARAAVAEVPTRLEVVNAPERLPAFTLYDAAIEAMPGTALQAPSVSAGDPALIIYTGGTTGRPKGVLHSQEAHAINLLSQIINGEIRRDERLLLASPLPHSAQLFAQAALLQGARVAIHAGFEAEALLKTIDSERITWTFLVPTMIYRLLDAPIRRQLDTKCLRTIVYGASPITELRLKQALEAFGPILLQIFGQTEVPNFVTTLSKEDHLDPQLLKSCGQPVIFCDVEIQDDEGAALESLEVGEVAVRSPYTLERYHNDPGKSAEAYRGEWLRTGDVGFKTATGHVFLVDRAKDMIITGGMNVYSSEVENVIQEFESVAQAMVIGIPDDDWGEAVTAFVVPKAGAGAFDLAAFTAHCRSRLAAYKAPKRVELIDAIPLTAYGKPDKKALRARYWAGRNRAIN